MHQEIQDYEILSSTVGNKDLSGKVLELMKGEEGGWQPWGHPFIISRGTSGQDVTICQAMVQYRLDPTGTLNAPPQPTFPI